ncbi:hypothetical protein CF70_004640 [Cupriavidus sp. SK-3]|nr:hypothetical protein CF70_004640 [Cupriavidus sp. SK-3]
MNWRTISNSLHDAIVLGLAIVASGVFYVFLILWVCLKTIGLDDQQNQIRVGVIFMVIYSIWGIIYLPKALRKAGLLCGVFEKRNRN